MKAALGMHALRVHQQPRFELAHSVARRHQARSPGPTFRSSAAASFESPRICQGSRAVPMAKIAIHSGRWMNVILPETSLIVKNIRMRAKPGSHTVHLVRLGMRPPGPSHGLACKQRRDVRKLRIGIQQKIEFPQPVEQFLKLHSLAYGNPMSSFTFSIQL